MTLEERAELITWVKERTTASLDLIRQGKITINEANRRTAAAKIVLRCIRNEDDAADVRAQLEGIFPEPH